MKLATAILVLGMATGPARAQNPDIIENTRNTLHAVQVKQTNDSNAALAAAQGQTASPQAVTGSTPAISTAAPAPGSAQNKASNQAKAATMTPASAPQTVSLKPAAPKPAASASTSKKSAARKEKTRTKTTAIAVSKPAQPKPVVAVEDKKNPVDPKKPKTISMAAGRRDPFISPVVSRSMEGSGCSTGKRCLAIDQIALRGVVKSDAGMIAVVVNALDKAYFLRENDPVFNGYVVKITGDSIVFKETVQDKLGKPFTRDVTKKIVTPAV
jgi:Tfp pilus assembly protein PilP